MNTSKHCKFSHHSLFYSKGQVSHCCMQKSLFKKTDWTDVSDLNEFYRNNEVLQNVKLALDYGVEHPACSSCWEYESAYNSSMRTDNLYYTGNEDTTLGITHVDLRLTNKCNLQCKMCFPEDSDQIFNLIKELNNNGIDTPLDKYVPSQHNHNIDNLLNGIVKLPNLKTVRLACGEPFIMPEVDEFLSKLIESQKTDITIELVSNCTSVKTKILEKLEKFKTIFIGCSIDGVGDTLEYQRYPAKWKNIESNFIKLYNSKCIVSLTPCIGILNYLDLPRLFEWSKNFNVWTAYNEITEPNFMNFRYIPQYARLDFYEKFSKMELHMVNPKWISFQKSIMYETLILEPNDCSLLKEYVNKIWDYKCNEKFINRYPWAEEFLNREY